LKAALTKLSTGSKWTDVGGHGRVAYSAEVKKSVMCCCLERWEVWRCATWRRNPSFIHREPVFKLDWI
jgi:hypothetical protein